MQKKYRKKMIKNAFMWCLLFSSIFSIYPFAFQDIFSVEQLSDEIVGLSVKMSYFMSIFIPWGLSKIMKQDNFSEKTIWESNPITSNVMSFFPSERLLFVPLLMGLSYVLIALPIGGLFKLFGNAEVSGFQFSIIRFSFGIVFGLIFSWVAATYQLSDIERIKQNKK